MKNHLTNTISQNIKKYRLLNNMTQENLANLLEMDTQYFAQLERGERNFSIEKIIKICSIFDIGIEDIIVIPQKDNTNKNEILEKINLQLDTLTSTQLFAVYKFILEIIPYVK